MSVAHAPLAAKQPVLKSATRSVAAEQIVGPLSVGSAGEVSFWVEGTTYQPGATLDARILGSLEESPTSARQLELVPFTQATAAGFAVKTVPGPIPPFLWFAYTVGVDDVEFRVDMLAKDRA